MQWVREGMRTFFKQPLALTGLFFMFMSLVSLLSLVPYVGGLLSLVLIPVSYTHLTLPTIYSV